MAEERNKRKVLQGCVVSDKMDKTIVVQVDTFKFHPTYKKRIQYSKKYKVHDEKFSKSWRYRKDYGNTPII